MTEAEARSDPRVGKDKHRSLTTGKILCILTGIVLVGLTLPPTISTALRRWPKLHCRYADINIKTGQARYARYLGFVRLSEEVRDTPISLALRGEVIDVADIEPWHRVYTASPGLISPHHRYHGALRQARELDMISELNELTTEEKREVAENILKLWQVEKGYFPVNDYLGTVLEEGKKTHGQE